MSAMRGARLLGLRAVGAGVLFAATPAWAIETLAWVGGVGYWDDFTAWRPVMVVPTDSDLVTIDMGHTTVRRPGEAAFTLDVGENPESDALLDIVGPESTLYVRSRFSLGGLGSSLGELRVSQGAAFTTNVQEIGRESGSTGIATVSGEGSTWTGGATMIVARYGNGTLNIADRGLVASMFGGVIGEQAGSVGTVNVSGVGSLWTNRVGDNGANLLIGQRGTGALHITSGAEVINQHAHLGWDIGSDGRVTIDGSGSAWINNGGLHVGWNGTAAMHIMAGGHVANKAAVVGYHPASVGHVLVSGVDSRWDNDGDLTVGRTGTGSMTIEGGAVVTNHVGYIGRATVFENTVTVDGPGSAWINDRGLKIGTASTGTLNVFDGAHVVVGSPLGTPVRVFEMERLDGTAFLNFSLTSVDDPLIDIAGGAGLAGTLGVALAEGATINAGDTFTLLDITGQRTGMFANAGEQDVLYARDGHALRLTYFGGDGNDVEVIAETWITGDLSGDGWVGAADLDLILANWGDTTLAYNIRAGDASGDGLVGNADLQIVLDNWSAGDPSIAHIPEPGSLAAMATLCFGAGQRRRRCGLTH